MKLVIERSGDRLKKVLTVVSIYVTIVGLSSFACFICEEAIQLLSFANFTASDVGRYDLMKKNLTLMTKINGALKTICNYTLWIQPLQFVSYRLYAEATDAYIITHRAKCLAYQPELFVGEQVDIQFKYSQITRQDGFLILSNNRFDVWKNSKPAFQRVHAVGILTYVDGRFVVDARQFMSRDIKRFHVAQISLLRLAGAPCGASH